MKNTRTTWTTPKTNIIAAANDLRKCLASGNKAKLIRILNEDCEYPILLNKNEQPQDFRDYDFSIGTLRTKAEIRADPQMSDFEKYLSLNYHACFGEPDAVKSYYKTGILSKGNFNNMGKSHLVKITDMIEYLQRSSDPKHHEYARVWYHYIDTSDDRHFYDTFRLKNCSERTPKVFKHKLYAVEMLNRDSEIIVENPWYINTLMGLLTIIMTPLKYIPSKSVLQMTDYRVVTYRVGDVTRGLSVDIHIPKKFGFKSA